MVSKVTALTLSDYYLLVSWLQMNEPGIGSNLELQYVAAPDIVQTSEYETNNPGRSRTNCGTMKQLTLATAPAFGDAISY